MTKIAQAAKNGDLNEIKKLVSKGYKDSISYLLFPSDSGLINAARAGHTAIVQYLLSPESTKNSAIPDNNIQKYLNYLGASKRTALAHAIDHNRLEVAKILIEKGADLSLSYEIDVTGFSRQYLTKNEYGLLPESYPITTPLLAVICAGIGNPELALQIIEKSQLDQIVKKEPYTEMTTLHYAVVNGQTAIIKKILEKGVMADNLYASKTITIKYDDTFVVDARGTPLMFAIKFGDLEAFKLLFDNECSKVTLGRPEVFEILLKLHCHAELKLLIDGLIHEHSHPTKFNFRTPNLTPAWRKMLDYMLLQGVALLKHDAGDYRSRFLDARLPENNSRLFQAIPGMYIFNDLLRYALAQTDLADFETIVAKKFPRGLADLEKVKEFFSTNRAIVGQSFELIPGSLSMIAAEAIQLFAAYKNFHYIKIGQKDLYVQNYMFSTANPNLPLQTISTLLNKNSISSDIQSNIVTFLGGPINKAAREAAIKEIQKDAAARPSQTAVEAEAMVKTEAKEHAVTSTRPKQTGAHLTSWQKHLQRQKKRIETKRAPKPL